MPSDRQIRLALWLALIATANANRKHFGLRTTWLPHSVGNTVALSLPELTAALDAAAQRLGIESATLLALTGTAREVTGDPPGWAKTVAPLTLAYVVSHPRFNIYKGRWGEMRLGVFGLDSIPHSATGYAVSALLYRTVDALARNAPPDSWLAPIAGFLARHRVAVSFAGLAALSAFYEYSEYSIHNQELAETGGDVERINMMWDVADTSKDILSNYLGWLAATLLHWTTAQPAAQPTALTDASANTAA
ncbi:MAG: hypothetical protein U0768_02680 [Anaerolineae bacterium]